MGADMYFNPPRDERKLWEMVRDLEEELKRANKNVSDLSKTIDAKNQEIKALQATIRSLGK